MRIAEIHLQDFRNLRTVHLDVGERDVFFIGRNGQGKTALLEACGLLTALRSFRTSDLKTVIRRGGGGESGLRFVVEHEQRGRSEVVFRIGPRARTVRIDGEAVTRLRDLVGLFPTVALSSQDIQLLRGGPVERRRFLDALVAGAEPGYFEALRAYHQALRERNALLRTGSGQHVLAAFDAVWSSAAARLVRRRAEVVQELAADLQAVYGGFAPESETPLLLYRPDVEETEAAGFAAVLKSQRERDAILRTTTRGPHRDDLSLRINDRAAREFGSEGQQRGMVIALKLAAVRWLRRELGAGPVILADDVLNELDGTRRKAFWAGLDSDLQVLATGTEMPSGERPSRWRFWRVEDGQVALITDPGEGDCS